ncbi:MAG: hypothetical protein IPM54_27915 [Polyangiaceae bacterium]|nr:hypothetical protein [Polyangiaceae bacterium]
MVPTIKRITLSLGFVVGLGFALVPQGCGGAHPVADIPEHVAAPIKGCVVEHTHHVRDADHIVKYDVTLDSNGQVDSIALMDSSVGDEELEQCMAAAIRSLTHYDLLRTRSENFDRELAQPESRTLLGTPAIPLAVCVASPPCLLTLTLLMGAVALNVQLIVHAATAKPTTTTTAPPISIPIAVPTTRYPSQTCEDKRLNELEAAKKAVCPPARPLPGQPCKPREKGVTLLPQCPCSLIRARIAASKVCIAARQKVMDECFKNATDAAAKGHAEQIQNLINGSTLCEALEAVNCAPGHPMSGL